MHETYFEQTPNNHLNGAGCKDCKKDTLRAIKTLSREGFIRCAKSVHGDRYDYSNTLYAVRKSHVKILCRIHGEFSQIADNHLAGSGCPSCGYGEMGLRKRKPLQEFIVNAVEKHGDLYDYSEVDYQGSDKKIYIVCSRCHKKFLQTPESHLRGRGCPDCSRGGYKVTRRGFFYVLVSSDITKVGITAASVQKRLAEIKNSSGEDFSVLTSFSWDDGNIAKRVETEVLSYLRCMYRNVERDFNGSTECFIEVDRRELLDKISEIIEEKI